MMIELKNVVKQYGTTKENMMYAMDHIDLSIEEGELCVILGPSGSGKSTLLNMVGGIDTIDEGQIFVDGVELNKLSQKELTEYRREKIGFIFQFFNLIPDLTAEENIQAVSDITPSPLDIDDVMKTLGIEKLHDRFPKELSGGQQQRIAIARSIIKNPRLLLCDELTGALDSKSSKDVMLFIDKINREYKTTIVIITHNEAIKNVADRIVRIKDGKIISNELNPERVSAGEIEL